MDDAVLLARFNAGEVAAFAVLLERYKRPMYNFLLRSVGQPQTAEDLFQEVFARVLERSREFEGKSKFSTWVYTIARNLCIDHSRRMKHRRHRSLDAPLGGDEGGAPSLLDHTPNPSPETDRRASAERLRERLAQAVQALPEDQREVFLMRQLQQLPFAEIASAVGISENTAKSRMRYALTRLQAALADYEEHLRALG